MELIQFNSHKERAQALAEQVKEDIQKLLRQKDMVTLAVSGGSTPKDFFIALSKQSLDWSRIIIMLVDERVVPSHDEDSNAKLVHDYLLQNDAEGAVFWSYLDEDNIDDEDALQQYANRRFAQPDLVVLGMGEDGHTASIFPESPQFDTILSAPEGIMLIDPKTANHMRLSLTLSAILNAQTIYIEIGGQYKNEVLHQAKEGKNPQYPISYVLDQSQTPVYVYTAS